MKTLTEQQRAANHQKLFDWWFRKESDWLMPMIVRAQVGAICYGHSYMPVGSEDLAREKNKFRWLLYESMVGRQCMPKTVKSYVG